MEEDDNYKKLIKIINVISDDLIRIDPTDHIKDFLDSEFDINYALPIDCEVKKWRGCTIFHLILKEVCSKFIPATVDLLLKYRADFTCKDHDGYTPLHSLFRLTNSDYHKTFSWECLDKLLPILVESKNAKNPRCKDGISHFHIACACGNLKIVEFFLKAGVSVNEAIGCESRLLPGYTPLHISIRNKDRDMVQLLLENGADLSCVNADNEFPLQLIFREKLRDHSFQEKKLLHFESDKVKNQFILDIISGPNVDESHLCSYIGLNKLHKFCIGKHNAGDIDDFEKLLNCANINSYVDFDSLVWPGFTSLHFAAQNDLEMVMRLLKSGADLLAKNASGITPLDICCQEYGLRTVGIILGTQRELRSIKLRDGQTLVDVIATLDSTNKLQDYLSSTDANNGIPVGSPLWPGYSLLHLAVMTSDVNLVKLCLERGADYTMKDVNNMTALHLAFRLNNRDCIDVILETHSTSANPVDNNNLSHFHIACMTSNTSVVKKFLRFKDLDPNLPTSVPYIMKNSSDSKGDTKIPAGSTAFHIAAAIKSKDLLKLLVKSKADPNLCDAEGFTWVHRVSFQRIPDLYKYLWKHPDSLKSNPIAPGGLSHLHIACCIGDFQTVKTLLPLTTNVNEPITSELTKFIEPLPGEIDLNEIHFHFISGWVNLCVGDTPFHLAAFCECLDEQQALLNVLIEYGADVTAKNNDGHNVVHYCYEQEELLDHDIQYFDILKLLILEFHKKGVSSDGLTAMHYACALEDISLIKKLLEEGADFNSQVDPDAQQWPGHAPLSLLVNNSNFPLENDSVKLLLQYFLDKFVSSVSANESAGLRTQELVITEQGLTAFHVCCMGSDAEMVEKFIKAGVDINVQVNNVATPWKRFFNYSKAGYSPVHYAVEYGSESVLKVLLQHGADVSIEDVQGRTPIQLAAEVCFDRVNILSRFCNIDALALMDSLVKNENMRAQNCVDLLVFNSPNDTDVLAKLCTYMRSWTRTLSQAEFEIVINHIPKNIFNRLLKFKDSCGCNIIHHLVTKKLYLSNENIARGNYTTFVKEFSNNIEVLLSKGYDLDHQDVDGKTPLHYAVCSKQVITVEILLQIGADINVADNNGITPYMYCYQKERWTVEDKKGWPFIHEKICLLMEIHIDHLRAAGLYLGEINKNCFQENFQSTNSAAHEDALNEMAQIEFYDSHSVRDLLTEKFITTFPVMPLTHRRFIRKCLKSDMLHKLLPEWSGLFKLQHRKILKNVKLFKPTLNSLRCLLDPRMPDHCLESILTSLNVYDWNNLREVKLM